MGQFTKCDCLVTKFCYQMIAKPGNSITAPLWPDPYDYKLWKLVSFCILIQNLKGIYQLPIDAFIVFVWCLLDPWIFWALTATTHAVQPKNYAHSSCIVAICHGMMTSSNGNIFRIAGPLCREFTGHWWIPLTKANDMELWCFLWSAPEETVEWTIETPMVWDATVLIMTSL